jgi:peptidoglycan/xylan/chitin deacetylase (PgdA/CDA1 family)
MKSIYMNSLFRPVLVGSLVMVGALFSLHSAFAASNLVVNGDLEQGSTNAPTGWSQDSWGTLTKTFSYPVAGNGGGNAAQVQVTSYSSGDAKWMFNHVPVTAGQTYQYSDNYKANVATEVDAEYKLSNGTFSYVWLGSPASTGTNWGTFSTSLKVPTGVVSVSILHVLAGVGTLAIDNVSLSSGTTTPPPAPKPTISSFVANPSNFILGTASSTTLSWSVSNASTTSIDQGIGVVVGNSTTTAVVQTKTYVLTATNPQGSVTATTTVTVNPVPPPPSPTCALSVSPTTILVGSSSVLSWSSQNANGGSIDHGIGAVGPSGTTTVSPTQTTVYSGNFGNGTASTTCTAMLTVTSPPAPKPTITSFSANPITINQGSSTLLSWVVTNASTTSINQGVGVVTGSSKSVSPTATTTYTLTATNPQGSVTAQVTVNVVLAPPPPPATTTPNLIPNGGFEQGSGSTPTGWSADYWGSLRATFTYPVAGNGSSKAARVVVTNWRSGDAKWDFNHINVSSHTIYQFSDDYISTVYDNVTVEFLMSNGTYTYQWVGEPAPTGGAWAHFSAEITVPVGAVSMTVLHSLDKNGSLTIDNASLIALPLNPFPTGMVTLSFDDGLLSQFQNARPILNTAGIKGGFFIITTEPGSGDTGYMSWAQITTLKNDGHEIGGHTRTHPDLTKLTAAQDQAEIKGSFDDLVANGFAPKTFVYPVGAESPTLEQMVKNAGYIGARGSYWGINSPTANRWAAYDIRVDQTTTAAEINAAIDQALADKRWIILELHDVLASGGDEYSITPATLQAIVNHIKSVGIQVVTLEQGMGLMQSQ